MQWRFHWLHFLEPRCTYDHADTRGNHADRAHLNEFGLPGSSVAGIRRGAEVKARQDSDLIAALLACWARAVVACCCKPGPDGDWEDAPGE